ncbi:mastermind-like protein 2 [Talpa occidentalis]|uniref:mastermind-like protein 2 n=1 Tax=Talpa occidentalis TaxID=50954 RepID=UPI0023F8F051|nr:mastermind-like protein 2 [Talpa occidentalis]
MSGNTVCTCWRPRLPEVGALALTPRLQRAGGVCRTKKQVFPDLPCLYIYVKQNGVWTRRGNDFGVCAGPGAAGPPSVRGEPVLSARAGVAGEMTASWDGARRECLDDREQNRIQCAVSAKLVPELRSPGLPRPQAFASPSCTLQGSLKRKQVVSLSPTNTKRPNGFVDGAFLDIKRIRIGEALGAGPGALAVSNGQSQVPAGAAPLSQGPLRKPGAPAPLPLPPGDGGFGAALKEVKKEPGEVLSCSKHADGPAAQDSLFSPRFGEDPAEPLMDPELQELFNELTSISVPPMSDQELENMINATIKQDDPFQLEPGQPSQRGTPRPALPLDTAAVKSEFSPGLAQGPVGSPQLRPPSAGPAFSMASSALSTSSPIPVAPQGQATLQTAAGTGRGWQEASHAQQLKQIAAQRQQHTRLLQQHQAASWPALPASTGPSPGPFGQEKIPSPSFGPQGSPRPGAAGSGGQAKVMASYVYKASPSAQAGHLDALMPQKAQDLSRGFLGSPHAAPEPRLGSTKPLFHFGSDPASQQAPPVLAPQGKSALLHYGPQPPPAAQAAPPLPSQPLLRSPLPLQQKVLLQKMQTPPVTGLGYQVAPQHRQDQRPAVGQSPGPGPGTCANPTSGSGYAAPQPALAQPTAGKKPALARQALEQQLLLQQQEKMAAQDQINRHLTRPPPDYKDQRRVVGTVQPSAQYSGGSSTVTLKSSQTLANPVSTHTILTPNPSLLSTAHGSRVSAAAPHGGLFGGLPCSQPGAYSVPAGMAPPPQPGSPGRPLAGQSSPLMPRAPALGPGANTGAATFAAGAAPPLRPTLAHGMASLPAQRTPAVMITPSTSAPSWASQEAAAKQQDALKPPGAGRFPAGAPAAYAPHQPLQQPPAASPQFPQRPAAPPNPVAPALQLRPGGQMSQTLNGQALGPLRSLGLRPGQLGTQLLSSVSQPGTGLSQARTGASQPALAPSGFPSPGHSSRAPLGAEPGGDLAFDFLSHQADPMGPTLNSDADFIDSLLKTEPGGDDWMKDINFDEILGSGS